MNSVGKWKIATYTLAATTAVLLYRGGTSADGAEPPRASKRDAAFESRMTGLARLRIPAAMAGIDEHQLLRDLAAANSPQKISLICERLGIFGTDLSLAPLEALSQKQPIHAGPALLAMGGIGSDQATERLIAMVGTGRSSKSYWAVRALAKTRNPRAESQLLDWAQDGARRVRGAAIEALGEVGGPAAIEVLTNLVQSGDTEILQRVLTASASIGTSESVGLIQEIAERGNLQLRLQALRSLPTTLSDDQEGWLMDLLASSDHRTSSEAAEALGRAQVRDALPLLIDAAKAGSRTLRGGAIRALAALGGDEATTAIEELFLVADQSSAYEIARAMIDAGAEQGRATFLHAMKDGHPRRADLLPLLSEMDGKDVREIRLAIARDGNPQERQVVLAQLAGDDDDELLEMMLDLAKNGPQSTRYGAMDLLANSTSPRARELILEMAQSGGQTSNDALRLLGDRIGSDPDAEGILIEALNSGHPARAQTASWALANSGSPAATGALMSALESGNANLATAAMGALGQIASTPEVTEVLLRVANDTKNPDLKMNAMYQLIDSGAPEATAMVVDAVRRGDASADSLLSSVLSGGGPEARELTALAAKSDSENTRSSLASALGQQGDAESMALLDTLTNDKSLSVKSAAIYAMAGVGSTESIDKLIELARGGDDEVRGVALSAVSNTGDPRATPLIAEALRSGDDQVAQNAIYSSYSAGPEVDAALLNLAENGEAALYLRQQAITALSNRGADIGEEKLAELRVLTRSNEEGYAYPFGDHLGH